MSKNDKLKLRVATGRASTLVRCKNEQTSWKAFRKRLSDPRIDRITLSKFLKLPLIEQGNMKNAEGWVVGGFVKSGYRNAANVESRDIIALDIDDVAPKALALIERGLSSICDYEFFLHTTRKHTNDKPRFRIFMPVEKSVPADRYEPVVRILSALIDSTMDGVDDVSFRASQLMYFPTICKDSEWIAIHNEGKLVDHDEVLEDFHADWRDFNNLPYSEQRSKARRRADKAEDPTTKRGIVGAFCRAYDVEEAIAEFLPHVYKPGDGSSGQSRYTFMEGSVANGAVVYDGGKFLYSNHDTDPAGHQNLNSFDLVRIHKFGHMDQGEDLEGKPITSYPSFKAMEEFARTEPVVREALLADRYSVFAAADDFEDLGPDPGVDEDEEPGQENIDVLDGPEEQPDTEDGLPPAPRKPPKPRSKKWLMQNLDRDDKGGIRPTPPNYRMLIQNDARLARAIRYNELLHTVVYVRDIDLKVPDLQPLICDDPVMGTPWQDLHDVYVRDMLACSAETTNGFSMKIAREDLHDAINIVADHNRLNPPAEYLLKLPEWDGVRRSLYVDYCGAEDNAYHREAGTLFMLAAICRTFNPGHEWQYVPILRGKQGTGKSTLTVSLFGKRWSGELTADLDAGNPDTIQQTFGMWGLELPEIANLNRGENDDLKTFVTITVDNIRLPYGRRTVRFPRRWVMSGTTNNPTFLKDPTGSRRFWPIVIGDGFVDNPGVRRDRDQLWAQALHTYHDLCRKCGYKNIPLHLSPKADRLAKAAQGMHEEQMSERVFGAQIQEWLDTPQPVENFTGEQDSGDLIDLDDKEETVMAVPVKVCVGLIEDKCGITFRDSDAVRPRRIGAAMQQVEGWDVAPNPLHHKVYGKQRSWIRADATRKELRRGYRIVPCDCKTVASSHQWSEAHVAQ